MTESECEREREKHRLWETIFIPWVKMINDFYINLYIVFGLRAALLILLWRWLVRPIFIIVHTCFMLCRLNLTEHLPPLVFLVYVSFDASLCFYVVVVFNCLLMCVYVVVEANHYPFLYAVRNCLSWVEMIATFLCSVGDIEFIYYYGEYTENLTGPDACCWNARKQMTCHFMQNQWFFSHFPIRQYVCDVLQFWFSQIVVYADIAG